MNSSLDTLLAELPGLRSIVEKYGNESLFTYAQTHYHGSTSLEPIFLERKSEFIMHLRSYLEKKFTTEIITQVTTSLEKNYCVSTAEHHGPMGHPFFFQSAILRGLVNPNEAIVNFCISNVSLGNSSYPRGFVFYGDGDNASQEYLHLPLFSAHQRMKPVFGLLAYSHENLEIVTMPKLRSYLSEGKVSPSQYHEIVQFLEQEVFTSQLLGLNTYADQITQLNHHWWGKILPDLPAFVPLNAEDIVCELLQYHLQGDTIITRILTDMNLQPFIEKYFNSILCCFDLKKKTGTYLFWYLDKDHHRCALWREGDELITVDGSFRVKLLPKEISQHISTGHLIPSGLLVYTVFSCYYSLTCFGGFSQNQYLSAIHKAYSQLTNTADCIFSVPDILNEDMIFCTNADMTITLALGNLINIEKAHKTAKNTTISQSLTTISPEIHRCL